MTIGQAGKRAQHFGQHRQNQYQLDYSQADTGSLTPPRRHRTRSHKQSQSQSIQDKASTPPPSSSSTVYSDIQRSTGQSSVPTQDQNISLDNAVQRDEVDVSASQGSGNELIQQVADQVFKMMLADVKKDRERNGGRFR